MESPFNRRSVVLGAATAVGLVLSVFVGFVFVTQVVFFSGAITVPSMTEAHVAGRTTMTLLIVLLGVRIAAGQALRRGITGGLGATLVGAAIAGLICAGSMTGYLLIGRSLFEAVAARTVVDLFLWGVATAAGVVWGVARTRVNPGDRRPGRAGAVYSPSGDLGY